jgi:hypothetical protein
MTWEVLQSSPNSWNLDVSSSSLPDNTVDLLQNMDFFAGVPRSLNKLMSVTVPSVAPVTLVAYSDSESSYAAYAGTTGAYAWTPLNTHVNITPVSGLSGSAYWDSTAFGKWAVLTNGIPGEAPHAISTTMTAADNNLAPLPGWISGASAKLVKTHRNIIWAANTTETGVNYPTRVRWSTSSITDALPSSWVVTAANDAGSVDLQFVGSEITDLCSVGDVMYIGGPGGIWAARWVGGQFVYNFSQINGIQGPRGLRCMESMGDAAVVLTNTDLLVFDENSEQSLAVGRFTKLINRMVTAELLYIQPFRQLYVLYSLVGETGYNHALIWDRDTNTFGTRDFQFGATASAAIVIPPAVDPTEWDQTVLTWNVNNSPWSPAQPLAATYAAADANGIYVAGSEPQQWLISRTSIPSAGNDMIRLRSIEAALDGPSQDVWLRIGVSDQLGEPTRWGEEKMFNIGGKVRNDDGMQGRYVSWQVRGFGSARLNEVTLYYGPKGRKP